MKFVIPKINSSNNQNKGSKPKRTKLISSNIKIVKIVPNIM